MPVLPGPPAPAAAWQKRPRRQPGATAKPPSTRTVPPTCSSRASPRRQTRGTRVAAWPGGASGTAAAPMPPSRTARPMPWLWPPSTNSTAWGSFPRSSAGRRWRSTISLRCTDVLAARAAEGSARSRREVLLRSLCCLRPGSGHGGCGAERACTRLQRSAVGASPHYSPTQDGVPRFPGEFGARLRHGPRRRALGGLLRRPPHPMASKAPGAGCDRRSGEQ
jgi:hypothetical protein